MARTRSPRLVAGEDRSRQYSADEDKRLLDNLRALELSVQSGEFDLSASANSLLHEFHRRLFSGVREHAGSSRQRDRGTEYLNFGPNRSSHRDEVSAALSRIMDETDRSLRSFLDHPNADDYEYHALRLAVWAHAEIVRIHPFEDGNGRTSRLLLQWILRRLKMLPVAVEIPKQEYNACLNEYFRSKDLAPLLDLFLRIYPV